MVGQDNKNISEKKTTRKKRVEKQTTPQARLASAIKRARDIMRKDKGLNGDADRLPMLTWIMFLKFLDDQERIRQDEAAVSADGLSGVIIVDEVYTAAFWALVD